MSFPARRVTASGSRAAARCNQTVVRPTFVGLARGGNTSVSLWLPAQFENLTLWYACASRWILRFQTADGFACMEFARVQCYVIFLQKVLYANFIKF